MSLRGRVIRRRNVSCYLKPESIQDQIAKFRELGRVFRARFYYNICGVTGQMSELLGKPGLLGEFPYPDLITGVLETNCPPDKPIWLRIGVPVTFTSNAALQITPQHGDVHRCVVFVDKSGGVPKLSKQQYLGPLADTGEVIDVYSNETVITTDDGKLVVATTTGNETNPVETPTDRTTITIPAGDIEIYMVLFATQEEIIADLANNLTSYSGPIDVDDWSNLVFS